MTEKEQILGLIRTEISEIDDNLDQAKMSFAEKCLSEDEWHLRNEKKINCKKYQAQIEVLEKLERQIEEDVYLRPRGAA